MGVRFGIDANDLAQAGWGIIFAYADPNVAAIQEALKPLLELRRQQAGDYFRVFTEINAYRPNESKSDFLDRFNVGSGAVDPRKGVPYYLLLVGDPEIIAFTFQYDLNVQYAVGRIAFETLDEYANYARGVVAAETSELKYARRATFFATANPDDKATEVGYTQLVKPLIDSLSPQSPDWTINLYGGESATKAQLLQLLGDGQASPLLFTSSHGMHFPFEHPLQLEHQGALICQDWPGPSTWKGSESIPQEFYVAADDIGDDAYLGGQIVFLWGSYTAGTPMIEDFPRRNEEPRIIATKSFVARLPQRLLGHPNRPALAVIGHVERAWSSSFRSKGRSETAVFETMLSSLMNGMPVGYAMESFSNRYADLTADLSAQQRHIELGQQSEFIDFFQLQTAVIDARNYIILGDPAARLMVEIGEFTGRVERVNVAEALEVAKEVTWESSAIEGETSSFAPQIQPETRSPFPGLAAFEEPDEPYFFARTDQINMLEKQLGQTDVLAVVGASGCGKSSLVFAGLVPMLKKKDKSLHIVHIQPGASPLSQLETLLQKTVDNSSTLLIVDPLEALFLQCKDGTERALFVERLLALPAQYKLILILCDAYWNEAMTYPALAQILETQHTPVFPLRPTELRNAIEQQAKRGGLHFVEGVLDNVLMEVCHGEGAMALAQLVLQKLWEVREQQVLSDRRFKAFHGLKQIYLDHVTKVYNELTAEDQARTNNIFLRLAGKEEDEPGTENSSASLPAGQLISLMTLAKQVTHALSAVERARLKDIFVRLGSLSAVEEKTQFHRRSVRRVWLSELIPYDDDAIQIQQLVDRLAKERLLFLHRRETNERRAIQFEVCISHPELMQGIPTLCDWQSQHRDEIQLHDGFRSAAHEWIIRRRTDVALQHPKLDRDYAETNLYKSSELMLNQMERDYIEACIAVYEKALAEQKQHEAEARTIRAAAEESENARKVMQLMMERVHVFANKHEELKHLIDITVGLRDLRASFALCVQIANRAGNNPLALDFVDLKTNWEHVLQYRLSRMNELFIRSSNLPTGAAASGWLTQLNSCTSDLDQSLETSNLGALLIHIRSLDQTLAEIDSQMYTRLEHMSSELKTLSDQTIGNLSAKQ